MAQQTQMGKSTEQSTLSLLQKDLRRRFFLHGAILFTPVGLIGCATCTALLAPANYKAGIGGHVIAQFQAIWMFTMGATLPYLKLSNKSLRVMYYMAVMGAYSQVAVNMIAAVTGGKYEELPGQTGHQEGIPPKVSQLVVKALSFGPILCGVTGSGLLFLKGLM